MESKAAGLGKSLSRECKCSSVPVLHQALLPLSSTETWHVSLRQVAFCTASIPVILRIDSGVLDAENTALVRHRRVVVPT